MELMCIKSIVDEVFEFLSTNLAVRMELEYKKTVFKIHKPSENEKVKIEENIILYYVDNEKGIFVYIKDDKDKILYSKELFRKNSKLKIKMWSTIKPWIFIQGFLFNNFLAFTKHINMYWCVDFYINKK